MNIKDLRPADYYAKMYGVKMVGYGAAGGGKTPLIATAPRPVMVATEAGLLSLRGVQHVPVYQANTYQKIKEFFDWCFKSNEVRNFDTIAVDSISQMSEIVLSYHLGRNKDGRKAYGEMARDMLEWLEGLYYQQEKHAYLIAKQEIGEEEGVQTKRPYLAGQELKIKIPHLYDIIAHIGMSPVVGMPTPQRVIRVSPTFGVIARHRSGNLNEIEPPDLTALFNKAMSAPRLQTAN
ncbi:TPA: AAA family ATPase [Salmonella enterica]|nr:AAA family ATPase [Salmonella enterica]